ncbi:S26 family signal peptidase [Rhizomonospora bruguierae]|uniref:S26 family signal peptidase n=1 Tax=Rhizomonospora bruguierae TaxID=1581705 RepID=UPI001BCF3E8D|nr:S26 family signal peptidase [Micromonospora sp. NBRC 107566]
MALLLTALPIAVVGAALWWARRYLVRVTVEGQSMRPTLNQGDVVLVRRTTGRGLRPGRLVIALPQGPSDGATGPVQVAGQHWLVKRVAALRPDDGPGLGDEGLRGTLAPGTAYLLGDNPQASYDSRAAGPFPIDRLVGVVLCRLREAPSDLPEHKAG